MLSKNRMAILANQMGTGKTAIFSALGPVHTRIKEEATKADPASPHTFRPSIIVCLPSTIVQLYEDIVKFLPNVSVQVYWGGKAFPHKQVRPLSKARFISKLRALSQTDSSQVGPS